jgi:hypothetical protein
MVGWNPTLHPRDGDGKFRRKASIGVRVSTRSVSATVGRRFPIIPGRANLYVGGLVRLENARRSKGPIAQAADRVQDRLINAVPEGATKNVLSGILKEGGFRQGSTLISASSGFKSTPTIRATRSSSRLRSPGQVQSAGSAGTERSPNRKPRTRSVARARRVA